MTPTETLRAEHRHILRVLGCLEAAVERRRAGTEVDLDDFREMVRFFKEFADRAHHRKEEDHLFPALERCGMPRGGGPIGVMLEEHVDGRQAVGGMGDALDASPPDLDRFDSHAIHFVGLLRGHIGKEDHVLFRMAENMLPTDVMSDLEALFEKVTTFDFGDGAYAELEGIATTLGEKYGVPEQRNEDNSPGCHGI